MKKPQAHTTAQILDALHAEGFREVLHREPLQSVNSGPISVLAAPALCDHIQERRFGLSELVQRSLIYLLLATRFAPYRASTHLNIGDHPYRFTLFRAREGLAALTISALDQPEPGGDLARAAGTECETNSPVQDVLFGGSA